MVLIALVLDGSGLMPVELRMCPRYCISLAKKAHLLFFMERFAVLSLSKTVWMWDKCSSGGFAEDDNIVQVGYCKG